MSGGAADDFCLLNGKCQVVLLALFRLKCGWETTDYARLICKFNCNSASSLVSATRPRRMNPDSDYTETELLGAGSAHTRA